MFQELSPYINPIMQINIQKNVYMVFPKATEVILKLIRRKDLRENQPKPWKKHIKCTKKIDLTM